MKLRRTVRPMLISALTLALAGTTVAAAAEPQTQVVVDDYTMIQAEDFQPGSGGYSDTTAANFGREYRSSAVDIAAGASGYYVGWTEPGEWLQYGLDVETTATYSVTVRIASNQAGRTFHIEVDGRNASGTVSYSGSGWDSYRSVKVDLGTIGAGAHTLRVVFDNGKLNLDQLLLRQEVQPAAPAPAPRPGNDYPGQPAAGDVLWGAFYRTSSGMGDVRSHYETPAGETLEVRRSFFQWSQRTTSMITYAREDIAAGRIPWVSIKPPSWAAMANGTYDAQIDQMLRALNALNGPVWLTIHHEPEGGGGVNSTDDPAGPAGHLAMNERVRERMDALGVDNVALAPVLMEWTFNPISGRNPNAYWKPGVYDFLGLDTYSQNGASFLDPTWANVREWAANKGVDIGIAEYGILGNGPAAATVMRQFYEASVASARDGDGARVVALTVFDSYPKGWALSSNELAEFREILSEQ